MVIGLLPDVLPAVKGVIRESCVDTEEEEVIAASAKAPVGYAIVAAHQFRWLVSQVCLLVVGFLYLVVALKNGVPFVMMTSLMVV